MLSKAAGDTAWAFDPDADKAELVVLAEDADRAAEYGDHFVRVGVDARIGYVPSLAGLPSAVPPVLSPAELEQQRSDGTVPPLVDVRTRNEHASGTIPGAQQLSAGKVLFHRNELPAPEQGPIVTFCQSGLRNTVAASALRRAVFDVIELEGSYGAWGRWRAKRAGQAEQAETTPTATLTCAEPSPAAPAARPPGPAAASTSSKLWPVCPPASAARVTPRSHPRRGSSPVGWDAEPAGPLRAPSLSSRRAGTSPAASRTP